MIFFEWSTKIRRKNRERDTERERDRPPGEQEGPDV